MTVGGRLSGASRMGWRRTRWLLLLAVMAIATPARTADPGRMFLGTWEGPANVFDEQNVLTPTNARLAIYPIANDAQHYLVEMVLFGERSMRFTRCKLINEKELRVRDEVLIEQQRIRVDGVLHTQDGSRIEDGLIRFFVHVGDGDYRPYYAVKLMARRAVLPSVGPTPTQVL